MWTQQAAITVLRVRLGPSFCLSPGTTKDWHASFFMIIIISSSAEIVDMFLSIIMPLLLYMMTCSGLQLCPATSSRTSSSSPSTDHRVKATRGGMDEEEGQQVQEPGWQVQELVVVGEAQVQEIGDLVSWWLLIQGLWSQRRWRKLLITTSSSSTSS